MDKAYTFEEFGQCFCGRRATGMLKDKTGRKLALSCHVCADTRLKKAARERRKEEKRDAA